MLNTGEDAQAKIEREVVADLVGEYLFTDKAFVQSLSTGNRNVFQKIWDEIKYLCKTVTAGSKEARQLLEVKKIFEEAYRAETKNPTGEGGVRYALGQQCTTGAQSQYAYMKPFADQIADYQNGNISGDDALVVGSTPDVLKKIGLVGLPMTINQKHVGDALNGTYKGTQQEKLDHTFTAQELATLPEKIADPVAIIYDKRTGKANASESTIDVIVEMTVASGKQVLAAVQINGSGHINGIRIDANKVATVHGNTDSITRLVDAINENQKGNVAVFYLNNDKTIKALQSTGNPIPSGLSNLDGFIHSITDPGSPVKMRITSVEESQQFKRWFGDWQNHPENASKVVNADGTPKVMYHGSPAQFTVFDKKKAKSSGLYGRGFYFTDSAEQAGVYGNQYAVYLDVKQPLQAGNTAISRDQVRGFLEAVAENEDYSIENYGTYDIDTVLDAVMGSEQTGDAFRIIQDINATAIGDMVEATGLFNSINGTNFDGIIVPTETVVFRPEQIKSATDNIGTFDGNNPDIRYSLSEQNQTETDSPFPLPWQIKGGDVALEFPLPPGYQEQSEAVNADEQGPVREDASAGDAEAGEITFPLPEGYDTQSNVSNGGAEPAGEEQNYRPVSEQEAVVNPDDSTGAAPRGKERKWVGTSTGSEAVDGKILPSDLDQELTYYQPISNKKTLGNANARLDKLGYDKAVDYFRNKVAADDVKLDDIALGERLIQEAVKKGDYLFTDKAFVQSLSTGNRNVFQKIWDEIKYLCKTVTAGSKEARQLLEVKKIFEEAYRAEVKSVNNTQYSLANESKRKYNKRSRYSEAETLFLRWENGSAPIGEVKKFVRYGKTHYYEKTENGCVELSKSQYFERNGADGENTYRRAEREIGEAYDHDERTQRGLSGGSGSDRDAGRNAAVFGQTVREELPDVTAGGTSGTAGYGIRNDITKSEHTAEASDDSGASSFITFGNDYATIRNFMKEGDVEDIARVGDDINTQFSLSKDDLAQKIVAELSQDFYDNDESWGFRADDYDYTVGDRVANSHELYQDAEYDDDGELLYPEGEGQYRGFYDAEELLSNPDNIELKIKRRQSTESATGTNQSNTSNELPSNNSIRNPGDVVNPEIELTEDGHPVAKSDAGEVQFSLSEADQAYTDAVNRGDMDTAQKMVDQAARDAGAKTLPNGRLISYYHGTNKSFTSFDAEKARLGNHGFGFYVTPVKDFASGYGEPMKTYLMTDNLATSKDHRITEALKAACPIFLYLSSVFKISERKKPPVSHFL